MSIDLFEFDWNSHVQLLSERSWGGRLLVALREMLGAMWHAAWIAAARPQYAGVTVFGFLVVALWFYTLAAVGVSGLHNFEKISFVRNAFHMIGHVIGPLPQIALAWVSVESPLFIGLAAVLAVAHTKTSDVTDVIDLYWRYFKTRGRPDSLRANLMKKASAAFASLAESEYDTIWIVGHSFGSVLAMEFVAQLPNAERPKLRLVTLGSFLQYLRRNWPRDCDELIRACDKSDRIERWDDFYSKRDFISNTDPLVHFAPLKYVAHGDALTVEATRGIRWLEMHNAYYAAQQVLDLLLNG